MVVTEAMGSSLSILFFEGKVGFVNIMKGTDFCANNLKGFVGSGFTTSSIGLLWATDFGHKFIVSLSQIYFLWDTLQAPLQRAKHEPDSIFHFFIIH